MNERLVSSTHRTDQAVGTCESIIAILPYYLHIVGDGCGVKSMEFGKHAFGSEIRNTRVHAYLVPLVEPATDQNTLSYLTYPHM